MVVSQDGRLQLPVFGAAPLAEIDLNGLAGLEAGVAQSATQVPFEVISEAKSPGP